MGTDQEKLYPAFPEDLVEWFGRLKLLYGVPYNYLVLNDEMLPQESIRFFYLDSNWIDSLFDGAYSIGRMTTSDYEKDQNTFSFAHRAAHKRKINLRNIKLQKRFDVPTKETSSESITGFLIRSEVMKEWPSIEITAYADDSKTQKCDLLRFTKLDNYTSILLFDGEIKHVEFNEPAETVHFGVSITSEGEAPEKRLRNLTGHEAGKLTNDYIKDLSFRSGDKNVLDLENLSERMATALGLGEEPTSNEFGLEMIQGVQKYIVEKTDS